MFSIGEFSRITGLSVKTLRHYHEKGLLPPPLVDERTGYRYYNPESAERARIITQLRALDFSLAEIAGMLEQSADEADILERLERQKEALAAQVRRQRKIVSALDQIIKKEKEAKQAMEHATTEVTEKRLELILLAGVRMKGKYSDCGKGFSRIGRALGRFLSGKPFCLYYDSEYREDDADFEACFPVKPGAQAKDGIEVRELPGGKCVALMHQGPYEELGRSYEKILGYIKAKGHKALLPSREVYVKGPGMIFKGNPKKYLTEIQIPIE